MKLRTKSQYDLYCAMMKIRHTNDQRLNRVCYFALAFLAVIVGSALSVSIGEFIIEHWM